MLKKIILIASLLTLYTFSAIAADYEKEDACKLAGFKSPSAVAQCIQGQASYQTIRACSLLEFGDDIAMTTCIGTKADSSAVDLCRQAAYEAAAGNTAQTKIKCVQQCAVLAFKEMSACMNSL